LNSSNKYKILVKILSDDKLETDKKFTYETNVTKNFLLWYTLVNNIGEELPDFILKDKIILFETYGYYNKEVYDKQKKENFIMNTDNDDHIIGYPGGFKVTEQKILLFKETIRIILAKKPEPTFETLKQYLIYFYLCELSGDKINTTDEIFRTYNLKISKYFDELWSAKTFSPLIYTYTLKYDKPYFIPEKNTIKLDNNSLIANTEKNLFLLPKYEYTIGNNELFKSVIDFYKIKYNEKYTLFIPSDEEKNNSQSINIIKRLLNSFGSIYLSLNFYYSQNGEKITGTNKNDPNIKIEYNDDNWSDIYYIEKGIRYKIIKFNQLPDSYHQFYNLMTNNDISLFVYLNEANGEYFLRTLNYDFVFKMHNQEVFYYINDIKYKVHFCDDIDIYNNYSILKLSDETGDKLLCMYNYNRIYDPFAGYTHTEKGLIEKQEYIDISFFRKKFTGKTSMSLNTDNIPSELKKYYYKIINKFDDKYVFNNIDEVLVLLLNCLNYNSPYLILKNIESIKNILNQNENNYITKLLDELFIRFNNIYSIPIIFLFYRDKILNKYYYLHANN
jgi:hypothetical protein